MMMNAGRVEVLNAACCVCNVSLCVALNRDFSANQ